MSVTSKLHAAGFSIFSLNYGDNEVTISAFGGQIRSWTKAGVPIVFENAEHAIDDGTTAYRGGAPICFPYFSKGNLLPLGKPVSPQHGHARTTVWDAQVLEAENSVVLTTRQPAPDGYGPTDFSCQLTYRLQEELDVTAKIRNAGEKEAPFQIAVHTYWATLSPFKAVVTGLGERYLDNLLGLSEHVEADSSLPHLPPVDRVYLDSVPGLKLTTEQYRLGISTQACLGSVLWNPGVDHGLKHLGSPDFICLESGVIAPSLSLAPGQEHVVEISYRVELL